MNEQVLRQSKRKCRLTACSCSGGVAHIEGEACGKPCFAQAADDRVLGGRLKEGSVVIISVFIN